MRVDLPSQLPQADFIPRIATGFQVKKPDMPASAIRTEMRPKNVLRSSIAALVEAGGAYVIVSAQGSVADMPLAERKTEIRAAVADQPNAAALAVDFYDRTRLASWANQYPGVTTWVRQHAGRALAGWRPIGQWRDADSKVDGGYLANDDVCLTDENDREHQSLPILDGIARLRDVLSMEGRCVRLIGLSGLGKTRLVEALFEPGVGGTALDPALSIYTDYSHETVPPARELARRLVDRRERAILIVDNCNPATHADLTRICSTSGSRVSLLTVEYDVRDDEPEATDVFRLTAAAERLVETWLGRTFDYVSQNDRLRIARFSDGNFRVARALAETLRRGETLGSLRNVDLFDRIFQQRNAPDQQLLHDAQTLALVYSFNGEDVGDGSELAVLARLNGRTPEQLFAAAAELQKRGIVQARGVWRAVLPQAIGNRLAASALERLPTATLDSFCQSLSQRLLTSFMRRISYLHDCAAARAAAARWLAPDGLLHGLLRREGSGFAILQNLAPVVPHNMLALVEVEIAGDGIPTHSEFSQRSRFATLLKHLAYDPALFERSARALARLAATEPENSNDRPATRAFGELFHMRLSGTQALPEQRRALIIALIEAEDPALQNAGDQALEALLQTHHFGSLSGHDFGARPRDFGWVPPTHGDIWEWANQAIALVRRFASRDPRYRAMLARHVRALWYIHACHDALEAAARDFAATGGWIDGWISFRAIDRFDGKAMPDDARERLLAIIELLKPVELIAQGRAFVLSRGHVGYDLLDGEDDDIEKAIAKTGDAAVAIGRAIAADPPIFDQFVPEVIAQSYAMGAFGFGRGLALGAENLPILWSSATALYRVAPADTRNAAFLGGFLAAATALDRPFVTTSLEATLGDPDLGPILPYLQSHAGLDDEGLDRLRRAAKIEGAAAWHFAALGTGVIAQAPSPGLVTLMEAVASLADGPSVAIDILYMRFHCAKNDPSLKSEDLINCGRRLLDSLVFERGTFGRDYALGEFAKTCLCSPDAIKIARSVMARLRTAVLDYKFYAHEAPYLIAALFAAQPEVALDIFLMTERAQGEIDLFDIGFQRGSPIDAIPTDRLIAWANQDPVARYPQVGRGVSMFVTVDGKETGLAPLFTALITRAPDKAAFLGDGHDRMQPNGWSGTLAPIVERRFALASTLSELGDPSIDRWLAELRPQVDHIIAWDRDHHTRRDESFE